MVNNVLLEHGHEEYRNKLARLGMPVFEVQEMFTNVENIQNGVEDILFTSGKNTLAEYLLTNTLPKDIACLLYTSPSPRDTERSRMPSSA